MLFAAAVVLVGARATAQCPDPMDAPFDSYPLVYHPIVAPAGVITVGCPGGIELPCIMSNEAVQINVTEGNQYQFSTCCLTCSPIWDTEITLWSSTGVQLGYDDGDGSCGSASFISWTATYTGTVTLTVAESPGCGLIPENPNTCVALSVTCTPPFVELCYSMTPTPYLAEPYAGTPLYMSDDTHSGVVNIGFDFCFDGVVYNQCVISSNNYVTFDLWKAGTYSPWVTVGVPSVAPTQPQNAILNPWQDIHPGACSGACIFYQTLGEAPFRRFVVSYLNVPMYSCTSQRYTSQTVLYESTNCIGSYILEKPVCNSWNSGRAVHGLQNAGGSLANIVGGRNNTQWAISGGTGMFYVPTCAPCSTATTGSCLAVILPLELLEFRGHAEADRNVLQWSTASEQNTKDFVVERSRDGEQFALVATLPAAGNSQTRLDYETYDPAPPPGMNYYRLRTIDQYPCAHAMGQGNDLGDRGNGAEGI